MYLFRFALFLGNAFWLTSGISTISSLTCYTCINITIPDLQNSRIIGKTKLEIFSDACWLPRGVKPRQQKCQHPDEVCTSALIFGIASDQRIMIRTCLNLALPDISNSCGFLRGANHSKSAHKFFNGFFYKRDKIITRICTCAKNNCTADNLEETYAKQYNVSNSQTLKTQSLIYQKFREIISTHADYGILMEKFIQTLPTITALTTTVTTTTTIKMVSNFDGSDQTGNSVTSKTPLDFDSTNRQSAVIIAKETQTHLTTEPTADTNTLEVSTKTDLSDEFDTNNLTTSLNFTENNSSSTLLKPANYSDAQIRFIVWILVPVVLLTALFIALISILILRRRTRPRREIQNQLKQYLNQNGDDPNKSNNGVFGEYDKVVFEIPMGFYKIDESKILYSGEYEKACLARITRGKNKHKTTAKMPKPSTPDITLIGICRMVQEIKTLSHIGSHEHIVYMVGAYTEGLKNGQVYLFHEICSLGPLDIFLSYLDIKTRYSFVENDIIIDLNKWARQIAEGMEFVASKHVVHADLCSKNILLDSQKTAKIASFGFARRAEQVDDFVQQKLKPNNWQWMPPESLTKWQFTEKSDVWAFGVLLWELYTLGDQPYSNLAYPSNFSTQLERGYRLERPVYANVEIHKFMLQCWSTEPNQRPGFSEILKILTASDCSDSNYSSLDNPIV